MMIRSPSVSTSTRAPSRRPARSAISLGMRRPRLLPQRATCTCIGFSTGVGIYVGYPIAGVKSAAVAFPPSKRGDLGRDDALADADDAIFEALGDAPDAADVAAVEIRGEPLASLPRARGRVGVGVSLAILMASSSVLKR